MMIVMKSDSMAFSSQVSEMARLAIVSHKLTGQHEVVIGQYFPSRQVSARYSVIAAV
jgi:hypothetical protein